MSERQPSEDLVDSDACVVTVGELRADCDSFLEAIAAEGGSREDAQLHAPGAAENPDTGPRGWLRYYQQLNRLHAVLVGHGSQASISRELEIDRVLAEAAADVPVDVQFDDGRIRPVYPKSYHALRWLDSLDAQHLKLMEATAAILAERDDDVAEKLMVLAPLVDSLAVRLWFWILTWREPGLPFNEEKAEQPPKWTQHATPGDRLRVFRAHWQVNYRRVQLMSSAYPSETKTRSRLPLAGFIAAVAEEKGLHVPTVMRNWSIGSLFATVISAAQSSRELNARIERERAS